VSTPAANALAAPGAFDNTDPDAATTAADTSQCAFAAPIPIETGFHESISASEPAACCTW
jgi:hypothetical protein